MYRRNIPREKIESMMPVRDNTVHMARIAIYCSKYVNGVAKIHTEILKNIALHDWYELFPERFQNKTNGITPRRWLALANPQLAKLITELLSGESWVTDLSKLTQAAAIRGR